MGAHHTGFHVKVTSRQASTYVKVVEQLHYFNTINHGRHFQMFVFINRFPRFPVLACKHALLASLPERTH